MLLKPAGHGLQTVSASKGVFGKKTSSSERFTLLDFRNFPAGQATHAVERLRNEYRPSWQGVQDELPSAVWNVPGLQGVHSAEPAEENLPAGHSALQPINFTWCSSNSSAFR
jgi:hypothetical protein